MSIQASVKSGLFWVNLSSILTMSMRFGGGIYLARKIDPMIFGQQVLILSTFVLLTAVLNLGEQFTIIREKEKIREHMEMQIALRLILAGLVTVVCILLYALELLPFGQSLGIYFLVLFIASIPPMFTAIYDVYMTKLFMFKTLSLINIFSNIVAVAVAVGLASYGLHLWALIWLVATERILTAVGTLIFVPYRFRPALNKNQIIKFLQYGKFVFLTSIVERVGGELDKLVTGNLISSSALGFYHRGFVFGGMVQKVIFTPLISVFTPAVGAIRDDKQKLEEGFLKVIKTICLVASSAFALFAIVAPSLIELIYGAKWLPSVPLIYALIPFFILSAVQLFMVNLKMIEGSSKTILFYRLIALMILAVTLYPLIKRYGGIGAAIAIDISTVISFIYLAVQIQKTVKISWINSMVKPLLIIGGTSLVAILLFRAVEIHQLSNVLQVVIQSTVYTLMIAGILFLIEREFINEIWKEINPRRRSTSPGSAA